MAKFKLIFNTNHKKTAMLIEVYKELFYNKTYNFDFSIANIKIMKQTEEKWISSFRIVKVFAVFEEYFKALKSESIDLSIVSSVNKDEIKKSISRKPLTFGKMNDFISYFNGWITEENLLITLDKIGHNHSNSGVFWNSLFFQYYEDRNSIVHSSSIDFTQPETFIKVSIALLIIFDSCCNKFLPNQMVNQGKIEFWLEEDLKDEIFNLFSKNFHHNIQLEENIQYTNICAT